MRIIELETTGLRGLRDGSHTLAADAGVTVVTGPPLCGLTSFLDAIALTATRLCVGGVLPNPADILRIGGIAAMVRSTWRLDAEERRYGGVNEETLEAEVVFDLGLGRATADPALLGLMSRYHHSPKLSKVVNIPTRRVTDGVAPAFADFEPQQRHNRLSFEPRKFEGLAQAVVKDAMGMGDTGRFERVQRLFDQLSDAVKLAGPGRGGQLEFSFAGSRRDGLRRLSFTERNAFVLAAAPVLMGLDRSVILLDTPELGLAPGVAARWLGALRGALPEAQWIVGSRDPAVVASVEPRAVVELGRAIA